MTDAIQEARTIGQNAAKAAASWVCDGNTDPEHIRRLLQMLADGDPESEHYLPAQPDLSGQWADDPTALSLARDVTGEEDPEPETIDAIADAFEEAVSETFEPACERVLRRALGEPIYRCEHCGYVGPSATDHFCMRCGETLPTP